MFVLRLGVVMYYMYVITKNKELDAFLKDWSTVAQNRENWREGKEAFALQWEITGSK